ncbi:unnamed protein product [Pleuronectes platessa]|uniref:Uncharacterized protein n=1 Tax=Pleuronectes platessa TaxID=8262 RepID=A0A9N7V509_PLEPL|nr:unnamed protein product [Pleuronectes platessa]
MQPTANRPDDFIKLPSSAATIAWGGAHMEKHAPSFQSDPRGKSNQWPCVPGTLSREHLSPVCGSHVTSGGFHQGATGPNPLNCIYCHAFGFRRCRIRGRYCLKSRQMAKLECRPCSRGADALGSAHWLTFWSQQTASKERGATRTMTQTQQRKTGLTHLQDTVISTLVAGMLPLMGSKSWTVAVASTLSITSPSMCVGDPDKQQPPTRASPSEPGEPAVERFGVARRRSEQEQIRSRRSSYVLSIGRATTAWKVTCGEAAARRRLM